MEPVRDIFASLFFAAIGMLIDPVFLWKNLELILVLVALVCMCTISVSCLEIVGVFVVVWWMLLLMYQQYSLMP